MSTHSLKKVPAKAETVQSMFDIIARRYDMLNRLLSLGIDRKWRKTCIKKVLEIIKGNGPVLDLATGTGDLSFILEKEKRGNIEIIAADFSIEMLKVMKMKKPSDSNIRIITADSLALPLRDSFFKAIMIGFGIRNFTNRQDALKEIYRVLKPGGTLAILEFSLPSQRIIRALYLFYFKKILPLIGGIFSKRSAYSYLPASVCNFPNPTEFKTMVTKTGFRIISLNPLTGGIATLYLAKRPIDQSEKNR